MSYYNSKYTGQQIDNLLGRSSQSGSGVAGAIWHTEDYVLNTSLDINPNDFYNLNITEDKAGFISLNLLNSNTPNSYNILFNTLNNSLLLDINSDYSLCWADGQGPYVKPNTKYKLTITSGLCTLNAFEEDITQEEDDYEDYFTISNNNTTEGNTIKFTLNSSKVPYVLYYRKNTIDNPDTYSGWQKYKAGKEISLLSNELLQLKGITIKNNNSNEGIMTIESKNEYNVKGNILSLISEHTSESRDLTAYPYIFNSLFKNSRIADASQLSLNVDTSGDGCFSSMFEGCSYLTEAPILELPSIIAKETYKNLFKDCERLSACTMNVSHAILSSGNYCYESMFENTGLQRCDFSEEVFNDRHATSGAFKCMFKNCKYLESIDVGTLKSRGAYEIFREMFSGCTNLTNSPLIEIALISDYAFYGMYKDCTSLAEAPTMYYEDSNAKVGYHAFESMFRNCTSLTDIDEEFLPFTSLGIDCYLSMFMGCTAITKGPNLPATTLAEACYMYMFEGCTQLEVAPKLLATSFGNNRMCYMRMFNHCDSLTDITLLIEDATEGDIEYHLNNTNNLVSFFRHYDNGITGTLYVSENIDSGFYDLLSGNIVPPTWTIETYTED